MRCNDCAAVLLNLSGFRYITDAGIVWCPDCLRDKVEIAWRHELARRLHFSAHGTDERDCEKCRVEDAERMLWGTPPDLTQGY